MLSEELIHSVFLPAINTNARHFDTKKKKKKLGGARRKYQSAGYKSSQQLLSAGINIAACWLTNVLLCLVLALVSFLSSLSLSKRTSLVFLLANGHLSSVFYFGKFWLLASNEFAYRKLSRTHGLSLVAPFVPVVREESEWCWLSLRIQDLVDAE